jgi:hypothetical protein
VRYQVQFEKTRASIVPVSESTDGDSLLEQGSWLRRTAAMGTQAFTRQGQEAVDGAAADLGQELTLFLGEV